MKKRKTLHLKEDDYGFVVMDGRKYRFKKYDTEKGDITFEIVKDEKEFKSKFDRLVNMLSPYINKDVLIRDVLQKFPSDDIEDLYERIFTKRQPIKPRRGCVSIMVGRKEIVVSG